MINIKLTKADLEDINSILPKGSSVFKNKVGQFIVQDTTLTREDDDFEFSFTIDEYSDLKYLLQRISNNRVAEAKRKGAAKARKIIRESLGIHI